MTRFRGWQQAALFSLATFGALVAFACAATAVGSPWRTEKFGNGQLWLPVTLAVLSLAAVPLFLLFARRTTRIARVVSGAVLAVGVLGVVAVVLLAPDTNPAVGIGQRVPLVFVSSVLLIVAGLAALAVPFADSAPRNLGQRLAMVAVPVVVVLVMVFAVTPLQRAYVVAANENLTGPGGAVTSNPRSELTGELAWTSRSYGYNSDGFSSAIGTPSGIAIARSTGTIDMLDPATGVLRWRYSRSDTTGVPDLYLTGGGRSLLAGFDDFGYVVLDAATGRRQHTWPGGTRDHDIENADPLLTEQTVGKGSDKLRGVDADGNDRWTFEPGRCTSISAVATADTAVVSLNRNCGDSDEVTGLDVGSGKKLWTQPGDWSGDTLVSGDLIVRFATSKELTGTSARTGEVKWRWEVPATLGCDTKLEQAGDKLVVLKCPVADKKQTVVTVVNAADGKVDWQQTAPIGRDNPAVTADARVVTLARGAGDTCELQVVEKSGYRKAAVPQAVRCNQGVRAVGNVVLARGTDSVVGLR